MEQNYERGNRNLEHELDAMLPSKLAPHLHSYVTPAGLQS
jgi:hypothetical protein